MVKKVKKMKRVGGKKGLKRRASDIADVGGDENSEDVSSSDDETQFAPSGNDEIQVSFDFFPLQETDFHGIKNHVVDLMDGQSWDASSMADAVVNQSNLGTYIKPIDQDDGMALLTVLNISQHDECPGMNQLLGHLVAKAAKSDETSAAALKQLLEDEKNQVGLVINERLLNTPYEVVHSLYKCLQNDINTNVNGPADQQKFYKFTHFLFVTKVQEGGSGGRLKKINKTKKKRTKRMLDEAIYPKFEEQCFMEKADFKFTFGRGKKESAMGQHNFGENRLVFCVSKDNFDKVVPSLEGLHPAMLSGDVVA